MSKAVILLDGRVIGHVSDINFSVHARHGDLVEFAGSIKVEGESLDSLAKKYKKPKLNYQCPRCQGFSESEPCANPDCPNQPCCGRPLEDCICSKR